MSCCIQGERPAVRVFKANDADVTSGIKTHCALGQKCFTEKVDSPQEILNRNQQHKASLCCACLLIQSKKQKQKKHHNTHPHTVTLNHSDSLTPDVLNTGEQFGCPVSVRRM